MQRASQPTPVASGGYKAAPAAAPLAASQKCMADAAQRAKNRLIVKRCYYKKIVRVVEAIEAEYERLLAARHRQDAQPTPSDQEKRSHDRSEALHDAYVQLLQQKSALRKENSELQRLETQHLAMEKQFRQLTALQNKALSAAKETQELKRTHPELVVNPVTLAQCLAIAQTAYREIESFRQSKTCFSTGTSIFGWRDRHRLEAEKLTFSLEKVFPGRSMEEVSQGTWAVLSQPGSVSSIYPRHVKVHFHVTQRLDENTVVYYHTLEREDTDVRVRAFILAMKVDLGPEQGCMVLYRGLDPTTYLRHEGDPTARDRRGRRKLEPQKEDVWINTFIWGIFERAGERGEHCKDDFGGVIEGTALVAAGWWCLEILQVAMRIEAQVTGSQILLQQ
ncbi:hypothetical protein BBJ28_00007664 [Nothophytophthora sp. Chile5]|nr:hypothetical protein BBJ28_00007664 [Nothophytophthora sp. Chile5]